jgi:heterodisulfide reductase subunit C
MENPYNQLLRPQVVLPERLVNADLAVTSCFQCRKCSGGCPLTFAMDLLPHHVIRLALLGQEQQVFDSMTIWVCSGCQTCTSRCPNGIDLAGTMDWFKEEAVRRGRTIPDGMVAAFHRIFLESLRDAGGRLPENKLLRRFTLFKIQRQPDFAGIKENLSLGWKLWKRRRLRWLGPSALRGQGEIAEIFRKVEF